MAVSVFAKFTESAVRTLCLGTPNAERFEAYYDEGNLSGAAPVKYAGTLDISHDLQPEPNSFTFTSVPSEVFCDFVMKFPQACTYSPAALLAINGRFSTMVFLKTMMCISMFTR